MNTHELTKEVIFVDDKHKVHTYGEATERAALIKKGISDKPVLVRIDDISHKKDGTTILSTSRTDMVSQVLWADEKSFTKNRIIKSPNLLIAPDSQAPNALGMVIFIRDNAGDCLIVQRGDNHLIGANLTQLSTSTTILDEDMGNTPLVTALANRIVGSKAANEFIVDNLIEASFDELVFDSIKMQPVILCNALVYDVSLVKDVLHIKDTDYILIARVSDVSKIVTRSTMTSANKYMLESLV